MGFTGEVEVSLITLFGQSGNMSAITDEIRAAVARLADPALVCNELPPAEGIQIFQQVLEHFVKSGDRRWWREDFRQPSISVKLSGGFRILPSLVPDKNELVWFIAEDDTAPFYPVFESNSESVSRIVGECYGFEYYIVQKHFEWLLCENHHDQLIGIGNVVEDRIAKLKAI